ncbi:SRPBCC family protein [Synechococcus sp. Nb3U1]|uniref:SRPBCC family protein n=1 Tax=Synechococcus sp. Nb3U1 TaxID=1914529 RepID=UPI001F171F5B|nr:SRPBCC family protein [Synechococcus sp. Nb3U1]MCF2970002.1 SRPBCC family protein [Synechococcus sp. Nb3U1]
MPLYTQSIPIAAPIPQVDRCITDLDVMKRWLNPLLQCEAVGSPAAKLGSRYCFRMRIPWVSPQLDCVITERAVGLVQWQFEGFFTGTDRWECWPESGGTLLINRFEFHIPNPWVAAGFHLLAAGLTQQDMRAQLRRLKAVAESLG